MKRILSGVFKHETNTFSPMPTGEGLFASTYLARGGDPGVGHLERARMVAMQGRLPDAAHEYDLGLAGTLSPEATKWMADSLEHKRAAIQAHAVGLENSYIRKFGSMGRSDPEVMQAAADDFEATFRAIDPSATAAIVIDHVPPTT